MLDIMWRHISETLTEQVQRELPSAERQPGCFKKHCILTSDPPQCSHHDRLHPATHLSGHLGLVRHLHEHRRHRAAPQPDSPPIPRPDNHPKDYIHPKPGGVSHPHHRHGYPLHQQPVHAKGIVPEPTGNTLCRNRSPGNRNHHHGHFVLWHARMASRQPFAFLRLLPSFPAMLSGTMASVLTSNQPVDHAKPMLIGGTALQGFGFLMSLLVYAEYVFRANQDGLPEPLERPEMFIAVGPWSFTAAPLIGMAQVAVDKWPQRYIISLADSSTPVPVHLAGIDISSRHRTRPGNPLRRVHVDDGLLLLHRGPQHPRRVPGVQRKRKRGVRDVNGVVEYGVPQYGVYVGDD